MNCGRSSSVEWKLPKLQRRVRFPSPAPPPPGRVPGGFVMPASRPPSTECGGAIGQNSPHASWAPAIPVQNSPSTPQNPDFGPFCASRENFVPLPGLVPVQNSPRTRPWQAHPVQNSPRTPQNPDFGPICASRENFVPLPPPTRRAGRKKSRTNTPPHPSNAPLPQFRMQFDCLNFQ